MARAVTTDGRQFRAHRRPATPGARNRQKKKSRQQRRKETRRGTRRATGNVRIGEAGKARKDSGPAGDNQPPWGNVFQHFHGNIYAEQGTFGVSNAPAADQRGSGRVQGRIEETEVTKTVQAYAKPACYDEAARALMDERVIILRGEAGSGRRAGAISMLDGVRLPHMPLVGFSPAITVEELAARSFDEGAGYLVSDMFDDRLPPELADFHWRSVCRTVRKSKAHLVVTIGAHSRTARPDVVRQFSWQRPKPAEALRAHLGAATMRRGHR